MGGWHITGCEKRAVYCWCSLIAIATWVIIVESMCVYGLRVDAQQYPMWVSITFWSHKEHFHATCTRKKGNNLNDVRTSSNNSRKYKRFVLLLQNACGNAALSGRLFLNTLSWLCSLVHRLLQYEHDSATGHLERFSSSLISSIQHELVFLDHQCFMYSSVSYFTCGLWFVVLLLPILQNLIYNAPPANVYTPGDILLSYSHERLVPRSCTSLLLAPLSHVNSVNVGLATHTTKTTHHSTPHYQWFNDDSTATTCGSSREVLPRTT